jgi:glycosyltransferase involved in cell wall biosynthesis
MQNSSITIAIPVLNGEKYIAKAIESALLQSRQADEVLVINNNSTDQTLSICQGYESKIKIVSHNETISMANNWTSCFQLASSDFVMICHADDELFPDAIKHTKESILSHPNVDQVFGQTWLYNGDRSFPSKLEGFGLLSPQEYFLRSCKSYYHYNSGTTTRKDLVLSIGGYSNEFKHVTDVDFFIRIAMKANAIYAVDEPLGTYRIHDSNLHKSLNQKNVSDDEYILLFNKISREYEINCEIRKEAMKNLFPVLAQGITKSLISNDLDNAQKLTNSINNLNNTDAELFQNLSRQSRLILNLCKLNYWGLNIAWLIVKLWEIIRNSKKINIETTEYNLEELVKITQIQSCE